MRITLAEENDIDRIMNLVKDCIKNMESQGINRWNDYYPPREIIQDDIERGSMYILKKNHAVLGIISLNEEQPPEYNRLNWSTPHGRILVIHRLAVNPIFQKQGIGRNLINYAENYAIDNGYTSIRLDAYSGNPRALRLYEKRQYKRVGQVYFL